MIKLSKILSEIKIWKYDYKPTEANEIKIFDSIVLKHIKEFEDFIRKWKHENHLSLIQHDEDGMRLIDYIYNHFDTQDLANIQSIQAENENLNVRHLLDNVVDKIVAEIYEKI